MPVQDTRDILIVGGGIAGLACAGFLREQGVEATVVEQAEAWDRVGWGIGLWENGLAVLDALGVADTAISRGSVPATFEIQDRNGTRLASVDLPTDSDVFLAIHRADLHAALRRAVPEEWVRMGTKPSTINSGEDAVTVTFDDGTTEKYDALIGADGINSQVRESGFTDWTLEERRTVVWSFWTPSDVDMGGNDTMVSMWAPGTEVFLGTIDGRGLVNIATTLPADTTPAPPALDQLRTTAEEIGGRLPTIVDALDAETDVFFDRNREVIADRWHRNRTVLIGDAAHAVHPISGMGAALALEDAYVLADELVDATSVAEAMAQFEERRRDRVQSVKRMAHWEERLTFTESALVSMVRNAFVRWTPVTKWFLRRQVESSMSQQLEAL